MTTHRPARFSRRSIHANFPLVSRPSRILFSLTVPWDTATWPNTCTSMGPFSKVKSLSWNDSKSPSRFFLVMNAPEELTVAKSSA